MQPWHIARTWYYLDIFLKITKRSKNILLSARNLVAHVSVDLLYSRCIYGFMFARARVCGVTKGALVKFST
jgi:hypothetical protein